MLLTVDVGNTNITFGLYQGNELKNTFRIMTSTPRTSDEYGATLLDILDNIKVKTKDIEGVIVASVVPGVMHALTGALERYVGRNPMIVGPGLKTGIKIVTENPKEIGADRIVDAVGAYEKYGGPVLVMDFGTATTYDLIGADGEFLAGITAPGIKISAKALWEDTVKLPEIEIKKPDSILAQNTVTSMQAGLVYGQIGQTEYIVKKVKEEAHLDKMYVVATGGLGSIIAEETDCIDVYDRMLTLDGLRYIYEKNVK
ncbi:MAG: Type III pantothenate kinase [Firmicutes bacterium ADurb.Bin354]|nr:MAG: Type III pantothenate kinase [Firmicutes bacterium ADurb.Bin354]